MGSSDRMLNLIQFEKCFSFKKSEENMTSLWRHSGSHAIGSEFDSSKCFFFPLFICLFISFISLFFHFYCYNDYGNCFVNQDVIVPRFSLCLF